MYCPVLRDCDLYRSNRRTKKSGQAILGLTAIEESPLFQQPLSHTSTATSYSNAQATQYYQQTFKEVEVTLSLLAKSFLQLLAKRGGGAADDSDRLQCCSVHVRTVGHERDQGRHQVKLCGLPMPEENAID